VAAAAGVMINGFFIIIFALLTIGGAAKKSQYRLAILSGGFRPALRGLSLFKPKYVSGRRCQGLVVYPDA